VRRAVASKIFDEKHAQRRRRELAEQGKFSVCILGAMVAWAFLFGLSSWLLAGMALGSWGFYIICD
jgi:hypothetical protein